MTTQSSRETFLATSLPASRRAVSIMATAYIMPVYMNNSVRFDSCEKLQMLDCTFTDPKVSDIVQFPSIHAASACASALLLQMQLVSSRPHPLAGTVRIMHWIFANVSCFVSKY
jgi:hypothetical protein